MKSKAFFDRLTVIVAACILALFTVALCFLPKKEFSEKERRALTLFPTPTVSSLLDGSFFSSLSDFCTDHFPLREGFTSLKASTERALGKRENNGILFGANGYLIARGEYDDLSTACQNLAAIRALSEKTHLPTTVAILPRTVDVLTPYLPRGYDTAQSSQIHEMIADLLPENADVTAPLRTAAEAGEAIFYRTDHHWTTEGAYLAYAHLAPSLGITPYTADYFTPTRATDSFLGTSFAHSGLSSSTTDTITLYRYEGDENYAVMRDGGTVTRGLYEMDALVGDDPYEVFLGGNYARLTVRDENTPQKPTLLIFKDSFANSLVPFLALHFDLVLIDPRYEVMGAQAILDEVEPDHVLILFGADTVATTPTIRRVER